MIGYHTKQIPKGVLGEFSKVKEEILEYVDAKEQNCKIMMILELADAYGAWLKYEESNDWYKGDWNKVHIFLEARKYIFEEAGKLGFTSTDLYTMASITERAFKAGERKNV